MKDTMFVLGRILGVLVFIAVFSLTGIVSGTPLMILAYGGFFIVVMFFIFLSVKRKQRHYEFVSQKSRKISRIIGVLMILIALAIPALALYNMQLFDLGQQIIGTSTILIIVAITIGLVAAGVFAVYLINREGAKRLHQIVGYLLIIIVSAVPALLVMPYDKTTTGIGSIYYIAIIVAIISWWGFSLFLKKD